MKKSTIKSPTLPQELQELRRLINRAKGLISFGEIKTYRKALEEVGLENGRTEKYLTPRALQLDQQLDFAKLRDIYEEIFKDAQESLAAPKQDQFREEILRHRDHLIELFSDFHWYMDQIRKEEYNATLNRELTLEEEYNIVLPPDNPKQRAKLFKPQTRTAIQIYKAMTQTNTEKWQPITGEDTSPAELLVGQAGHGKTFVIGQIIRWMHDSGFIKSCMSMTPWPILYVTKASVVEQSERDLKDEFGLDTRGSHVFVTNYDSLRASLGSMFIDEEERVQDGVRYIHYKWKPLIRPIVFIWDECQALKNLDSQQSLIAQAVNDVQDDMPLKQLFSSATPYTRTVEAKTFAVATRLKYTFGLNINKSLDNKHWTHFVSRISEPAKPHDYSPAAVARLTAKLEPFIVRLQGLRPKFHAKNQTVLINFRNEQEKKEYNDAWEEYQEQKRKIEQRAANDSSYFCILAALTVYRSKASLIRAPVIAEMCDRIVKSGKAVAFGVNFKPTIAKVVRILHEDYGYSRDQISLIWGGSAGYKGKEDLYTNEEIAKILMDAAMGKEVPKKVLKEVAEQIKASAAGLTDIPKELDLGNQSLKQRQKEIDKYMRGTSLIAGFTFKAGGVGLSLHHTDRFCTDWRREHPQFQEWYNSLKEKERPLPGKTRKTEAGWAIDEDIKFVTTRPREGIFEPTYSAIEMVQALGRLPRLTSLSDTIQSMLFYRGTIEQQVAAICATKFKCLKEVVQQRESWMDLFTKGKHEALSLQGREMKQLQDNFDRPPEDEDELAVDLTGIDNDE